MIDKLLYTSIILMAIVAFIVGGALVILGLIKRHRHTKELLLTLIALASAGVSPNLTVFSPAGFISWSTYFWYLVVPGFIVFIGILIYAYVSSEQRLFNQMWVGMWAGFAATIALDIVRLTGFKLGYMPGNMPRMFGVMIWGNMLEGPNALSDFIGYTYHFWNGCAFGIVYALIFGKTSWIGPLIYSAVFVETGMMISPAMLSMGVGPFGINFGPELFIVSLLAHIAMGIVMGVILQRYVRDRGTILKLLPFGEERSGEVLTGYGQTSRG